MKFLETIFTLAIFFYYQAIFKSENIVDYKGFALQNFTKHPLCIRTARLLFLRINNLVLQKKKEDNSICTNFNIIIM